jgi:hypothetical protein
MTSDARHALIPHGEYCYRVVELAEGEPQPPLDQIDSFGKHRREASYAWGYKRVLCPYWQVTDHGTVRCDYLAVEAVMEHNYQQHLDQAIKHFGTPQALEAIRVSAIWLTDEIKVCDINLLCEQDDEENPFIQQI